jgi:SAM-dependent methyltransferase
MAQRIHSCLAAWWDAVRARVEGPELEPSFWHSSYLVCAAPTSVLRELGATLNGRVLDIGAGTGYAARFLDRRSTDYLPTDLPSGRNSSDETISCQGVRPRIYCDGASLPLADASIDGVISFSVLEHVADVSGILRDAYRVLRPGGRMLISTPFFYPFHGEPDDYRRWTVHGLATELQRCGFEIEDTRRLGSSMSALVLNLHLMVKHEWRTAPSPLLRFVSRWAWPAVLVWQGATNLLASSLVRYEPESRMPLGVAVIARRPIDASC